jgi:AcrR family transcriptional regulator
MTAATDQADPPETTRERILRIGAELFARNGYHATGISELSKAVGLGRGALYHHIASKEDLLREISISLLSDVTSRAREIQESGLEPEAKLRALARQLVRDHAERREVWNVAIAESRALSPDNRAEVIAARDVYEGIWADVLTEGERAGVLVELDGIDRNAILGALNSTARWMDPDGPLTPEQIADRHMDLLLRGLRPR